MPPELAEGVTEEGITGLDQLNQKPGDVSDRFKFATSQTPAQESSAFSVNIGDTIPAAAVESDITLDDVFDERNRLEETQGKPSALDELEQDFTEPTPFSDPGAFIEDALFGEREQTEAEKAQAEQLAGITEVTSDISGNLETTRTRAEETTGIGGLQAGLAETNEQIARRQERFRREMREFETDAQERGVAREFVTAERNKKKADATAELADLYIIQNAQQGNVDSAISFIDTAVDNRYRNIQLELAERKARLEELIPTLEGEEKLRAQQLQLAINERENNIETEKEEAKERRQLLISASAAGATDAERKKIMSAGSLDQAYDVAAAVTAREFRASQAGTSGIDAPTIKTINGVDYQWNDQLGIWEDVAIAGGTGAGQANETTDNLAFLLDVTDRILGNEEKGYDALYKGSAQAPVSRGAGILFTGTNKQRRLEAQVDSLRSNMLTLATDPSIKKFFGPQMSDADVRLMTAAGTTLRPGSQSDTELQQETARIQDLLNRMNTAVQQGANSNQNLVTAPDGTLIQIVD